MKILFISKPFIIPKLGIMYLSSALKRKGHETKLLVADSYTVKEIKSFNPDIIAYSVMTGEHNYYLELNRILKSQFTFFSVFGGPHPTFFPDMIKEDGVDAICIGEGEEAFCELMEFYDLKGIKNFWFKTQKGEIIKNEVRPFSDIEKIEMPDRELVPTNGKIKHFICSRGCPFNCSYCFNNEYFNIYGGKKIRVRSPQSVVHEIEISINNDTRFIYFQDDIFPLNSDWLRAFSILYKERVGLPFHCHLRADLVNDGVCGYLKLSGCRSVHLALECANDEVRYKMLRKEIKVSAVKNAIRLLKEYKIKVMLQNIIGIPETTLDNDIETLKLNIKLSPDYSWVSIFQPYPGTQLGDYCIKNKLFDGNLDIFTNTFFDYSVLNFDNQHKNQLSNLQKLFALFVKNPHLVRSGVYKTMLDVPFDDGIENLYRKIYKDLRAQSDKILFGFDL